MLVRLLDPLVIVVPLVVPLFLMMMMMMIMMMLVLYSGAEDSLCLGLMLLCPQETLGLLGHLALDLLLVPLQTS